MAVRGSHLLVIPSMCESSGLAQPISPRYGSRSCRRSAGWGIPSVAATLGGILPSGAPDTSFTMSRTGRASPRWRARSSSWRRDPEDFRYLTHHGMRVDRLCGRAPLRRDRGPASRTGSLEVVIAYDDDLPVAELGDVGRFSSSVHRRERARVRAVEDQVPVLACP